MCQVRKHFLTSVLALICFIFTSCNRVKQINNVPLMFKGTFCKTDIYTEDKLSISISDNEINGTLVSSIYGNRQNSHRVISIYEKGENWIEIICKDNDSTYTSFNKYILSIKNDNIYFEFAEMINSIKDESELNNAEWYYKDIGYMNRCD